MEINCFPAFSAERKQAEVDDVRQPHSIILSSSFVLHCSCSHLTCKSVYLPQCRLSFYSLPPLHLSFVIIFPFSSVALSCRPHSSLSHRANIIFISSLAYRAGNEADHFRVGANGRAARAQKKRTKKRYTHTHTHKSRNVCGRTCISESIRFTCKTEDRKKIVGKNERVKRNENKIKDWIVD